MAYKLQLMKTAKDEVDAIVGYLSQHSIGAAKDFKRDWYNCLDSLRDGIIDYGFSRFSNLADMGYHAVLFSNYVLLYFEEGDTRTIAHVFHQKQNYASFV